MNKKWIGPVILYPPAKKGNRVLFCVDNTPGSILTADYKKGARNLGIENLHRVKGILLKKGVEESKIELKTVDCDEKSLVSDQILEELKSGRYDTVLVSKHDVTRTQEFFFGDATINLIRKSPVPAVLVAKGLAD